MNRCFGRFSLKVLLHKAIFPETCNATDDDSIVRQVAEYISRCNLSCNVVKSQKPSQLQSNCLRMQIYDLFSVEDLPVGFQDKNIPRVWEIYLTNYVRNLRIEREACKMQNL